MQAQTFYKVVTMDKANLSDRIIALLNDHGIRYCVIGGQAVNAYADPVVSLDLDIVIAAEQLSVVEELLRHEFKVEHFPHRLNVSAPDSRLRIQIQTDARYADFVGRAVVREVLDMPLAVAAIEDVLQGKVWEAQDPTPRGSKRQKDLADIARLIEAHPPLRARVPQEILDRLI